MYGLPAAAAVRARRSTERPLVHARRGSRARPRRRDRRATSPAQHGHARRRPRHARRPPPGPASFRVIGMTVDASGTTAPASSCRSQTMQQRRSARRHRQRLPGSGRRARDHGADRPDDDAARGHADAHGYDVGTRSSTRPARNVSQNRQITHGDRRARPADRRDQHGRPGQRDHDERARADARDRRPALHRRPRPRHPPHLRRRGHRGLARRLAARHPGRLRARPHVQLAAAARWSGSTSASPSRRSTC